MDQITLETAKLPYVQIGTKRFGALDVHQAVQRYNHPLANAQGRPIQKSRQIQLGWIILAASFIHLKMANKIQSLQKRLSKSEDDDQNNPAIRELQQMLALNQGRVNSLENGLQSASNRLSDQIAARRKQLLERKEQLSIEAEKVLSEDERKVIVFGKAVRCDPSFQEWEDSFQSWEDSLVQSLKMSVGQIWWIWSGGRQREQVKLISYSNLLRVILSHEAELRQLRSMEETVSKSTQNLLANNPIAVTTQGQAIASALDTLCSVERRFQGHLELEKSLIQNRFDTETWEILAANFAPCSAIDSAEANSVRESTSAAADAPISGLTTPRTYLTVPPRKLKDAVAKAADAIVAYLDNLGKEVHQSFNDFGNLANLAPQCTSVELSTLIGKLELLIASAKQKLSSLLTEKSLLEWQEGVKETEQRLTRWLSQVDRNVATEPVLERTWLMVGCLNDWVAKTGSLWTIAGQIKWVRDELCKAESTLLQASSEIKGRQHSHEAGLEEANSEIDDLRKAQKSIESSLEACANGGTSWAPENNGINNEVEATFDQASFDLETKRRGIMLLQWHPKPKMDATQEPDFAPFTQEIGALFLGHCLLAKANSFSPTAIWELLPSLAAHAERLFQTANVTYEIDFMLQPPPIEINYVNS